VVRFHQVFKPVAHGSSLYYRSEISRVPNLVYPIMQPHSGVGIAYFARAYLLNWLAEKSKFKLTAGIGFVQRRAVESFLGALGLNEGSAASLLEDALAQGMLEPDVRMTDEAPDWSHLKITPKGFSVVRRLAGWFAYWESIMMDTPLDEEAVLARIKGAYLEGHQPSLYHRMQCVKEFLAFLTRAEDSEQLRVMSAHLRDDCPAIMPTVNEMMVSEYARIQEEIKAMPGV
jgi:hypothetical protein